MKTIVTILIFLGTISISSADIVTTTDGSSYAGEISSVTINTEEEGAITFERAEISSIEMGGERHPEEKEVEEPKEEVVPQEPEKEVQEEEPLKEPEVVEEEKKEETTQEEKPQIIGPQIRGLDGSKYKTY